MRDQQSDGYDVGIAVLRRLPRDYGSSSEAEFSALISEERHRWGLGSSPSDNGVLAVVAFEDRLIHISAAPSVAARLSSQALALVIAECQPSLHAGEYDVLLKQLVDGLSSVLKPPLASSHASRYARSHSAGYAWLPWPSGSELPVALITGSLALELITYAACTAVHFVSSFLVVFAVGVALRSMYTLVRPPISRLSCLRRSRHRRVQALIQRSLRPATCCSSTSAAPLTCAICLEDLTGLLVTFPCTHSFDVSCAEAWLHRCFSCPLCRMDLTPSPCLATRSSTPSPTSPPPSPSTAAPHLDPPPTRFEALLTSLNVFELCWENCFLPPLV